MHDKKYTDMPTIIDPNSKRRKSLKAFLFLSIILTITGFSCLNAQKPHLLLTHPTVFNIKSIAYLMENDILELPEGTKITGVYYAYEKYDYQKTRNYLAENDLERFHIQKLTDSIPEEKIFTSNALSDDFKALFQKSDGIMFFGGADMPPSIYGEKTHLLTSIYDPQRHFFEVSFLAHLLGNHNKGSLDALLNQRKDYVIYGFCLGMQTMNVAAGGTLIQDIPLEKYNLHTKEAVAALPRNKQHRNYQQRITNYENLLSGNFHQIRIKSKDIAGSPFQKTKPRVLSNHHQAVDKLGADFNIAAYSTDKKIPEAFIHKKFPNVLGVQFHPEPKYIYQKSKKFRYSLDSAKTSGPEILNKSGSMKFHHAFWDNFTEKFERAVK